jgi:hypothetical protein
MSRWRDRRGELLSSQFARLVSCPERKEQEPASLLGLEQEFEVWWRDKRVDFRSLVHNAAALGRRLDPGDPNAYRCSWGE